MGINSPPRVRVSTTASITAMFAQRYSQDVTRSAQLVTLSTLCSVLTLPCFAVLAAVLSGNA